MNLDDAHAHLDSYIVSMGDKKRTCGVSKTSSVASDLFMQLGGKQYGANANFRAYGHGCQSPCELWSTSHSAYSIAESRIIDVEVVLTDSPNSQ